jgi:hypothetical protein
VLFDSGNRGSDQAAHRIHGSKPRRAFGPATQAWPESRGFRTRRARIKSHVLSFRRPHGTDGTAVNMGRRDSNEKPTVESTVASRYRAKAGVRVEFHDCRLTKVDGQYSPFSDLSIGYFETGEGRS